MPCGCGSSSPSNIPTDCTSLTVGDFQSFLNRYQCVKDNNLFDQVGIAEAVVDERISILNDAIADKQSNPTSCNYYNTLPALTEEVTRIVTTTICT